MKLIIAGGRNYIPTLTDLAAIATLLTIIRPTMIISGGATGADAFGERIAKALRLSVSQFLPKWNEHGKAAGPMRNGDMAEYADACILLPGGTGTQSMFHEATKAQIPIYDLRREVLPS